MKVYSAESVPADGTEHGKGAYIRWVIAGEQGAPNFAMRIIEIEPGGHTPFHQHGPEHEVYVLEGSGHVKGPKGEAEFSIQAGDVALVLPNEEHQFVNVGDTPLKFICVIPIKKDQLQGEQP
ncbi:MAG TPA: cupin domain-containing protein [Chloroflexota bacterium]|nr:cupin domain-containing protein [Chloroflexota bacterium]